ncbi:TonB-dependent receptor [Novosphingobium sp.]|uniref:TonB-dependent receptor n=1 Tax=Novosphingobium sp. TaxID=1874826 RepID=UPI0025D8859B|nr:TonB-dependent receptor [Novosphingobium sp.]
MNRKITFLAGTALACIACPAMAQTAPAPQPEPESSEIIVTGIRGSLQKAAEIKRNADQVLDVITAEDVGKLPDANIAEALQRVTGVQISRVFGEGQAVNIRGLQQVRVEVDGRTLLGWSARVSPPENDNLGRSSGLDSVPSSLFGRLEVRKSPLASQVEGGLGGSVNLVTPKPFDFKRTTVSLRASGTYSEGADKFEPGFAGLFTTKLADDSIGILISADYQKRSSHLQLFERNNFFNALNGVPAVVNGVATQPIFVPRLLQYENTDIDRSRFGINGAIQFRVSPELTITADGIYSEQKANRTNQFIAFNLANTATGLVVSNPILENNYAVAGSARGNIRTGSQAREDPTTTMLAGLNAKYDDGRLSVEADAYYSRGTLRQKIEVFTLQTANNSVIGTYDFRGRNLPDLTLTTTTGAPFNPLALSNYPQRTDRLTIRANLLPANLDEKTGRLDFGYNPGGAVKVRAGVRYTDLRSDFTSYRSRANATNADLAPFLNLTGDPTFLAGIPGNFPRQFLTATPGSDYIIKQSITPVIGEPPAPGDPLARNSTRDFKFKETTLSGYLMFDAEGELFGRPAKANAGVRISNTDLTVDTLSQLGSGPLTPRTDTNSYTNVLPSANLVVNVTDNFLMRLSASQTLQRAGIQDLAPSTFVDATNRSSTSGNAQLTPPISSNLDLSFEYYTGKTSLISGALFYKKVENFIITNTSEAIIPGFESLGLLRVVRPENVASAKVKGFEIGITQFFDFLPSPFDGFGVIANYTYADSKDSNGFPLQATSKHSYNLVALFEKGPISARVAYNWRDDAVFEFTQGRPEIIAARSQLDAQVGIDITKKIALSFQAQNLMPEQSATREISNFTPNAINSYALSERRFSVGLRVKY